MGVGQSGTDRNLEVHQFLGKSRHIIREAKLVISDLVCGEDEVSLSFFTPIQNDS